MKLRKAKDPDVVKLTRAERAKVQKITNRLSTVESHEFESSSSRRVYHTVVHDDGKVLCDCQGWTVKKTYKPRQCKHIWRVIGDRPTSHDDEYVYIMGIGDAKTE